MNASELRKLSIGELETKLADARHELMNLRFQQVTGQLTDTNRMRFIRRDIARMSTIIREMEADEEGVA
jgi:large subunit ribosomal protein L29